MSEDRPRAAIVELLAERLGQPLVGRNGEFYICTINDPLALKGPYADYFEAERRSRGLYTLINSNEIHPGLWGAGDDEESLQPGEVELEQSVWYDKDTGIGVWEAVVWAGGRRVEEPQRKRFWIYQLASPVVLGMSNTPNLAIDKAKEFVAELKRAELKAKETLRLPGVPEGP